MRNSVKEHDKLGAGDNIDALDYLSAPGMSRLGIPPVDVRTTLLSEALYNTICLVGTSAVVTIGLAAVSFCFKESTSSKVNQPPSNAFTSVEKPLTSAHVEAMKQCSPSMTKILGNIPLSTLNMGEASKVVIRSFQEKMNLPLTGEVDKATEEVFSKCK